MTYAFDERGERAIARLRADPRFNEALYRKYGPVKYWVMVRDAEDIVQSLKRANGQTLGDPPQGHGLPERTRETPAREAHPTQREYEDEMSKLGNGLPLEKATRERSKAVNAAASIILICCALGVGALGLTVVAMCCYGLWTFAF